MTKTVLKIICFFSFIFLSILSKSQDTITLYYNSNWEITKKEKALYLRKAEFDLNTFKLDGDVKDFTLKGTPVMSGHYISDRREGDFIFSYPSGSIKSKGRYKDNQRIGNWEYYYENGKLRQEATFFDTEGVTLFSINKYFDSSGNELIQNGTGEWLNDSIESNSLENKGLCRLKGHFKDSLRTGTWKLYRIEDNKLIHTEQFRKGKFLEASVYEPLFDSYGTTNFEFLDKFPDINLDRLKRMESFALDSTVFPKSLLSADVTTILRVVTGKNYFVKNRRAGYTYGDQNLLDFIGSNIRYPRNAIENKITGKVYVKVVIDSNGSPKEVSIYKGINKDLDEEALRVVKLIDSWLPAIKEGKPIESSISIPVLFDIQQ
jgi:TonB family protein